MNIAQRLAAVSADRIEADLRYLCSTPLPRRTVNFTLPGHEKSTLEEADDYIQGQLEACGLTVQRHVTQIQPYRCDETKPLHHWYSAPAPEDPFYDITSFIVDIPGTEIPDEILVVCAHKDSMSWIASPGAHDNGTGTVTVLELARQLAVAPLRRTVRLLFCNEEHSPWTSRMISKEFKERGDNIVAVQNCDAIAGKCTADHEAGVLTHVVGWSVDAAKKLAEFSLEIAREYVPEMRTELVFKQNVNDDDGMFIKAGYETTIMHIGSYPYADAEYHLVTDTFDRVDIPNVAAATRLVLATTLKLDQLPVPFTF